MSSLRYVPVAGLSFAILLALVVSTAVAAPALRRRDLDRALRNGSRALLAGAVLALVVLTLVGTQSSVGGVNLRPGAGIASSLANLNQSLGVVNIVGNVLMFVPVGLLLPVAFGTGWLRSTGICAGLSLSIELAQLFMGRSADIDDVLLNTAGGALGAAVGVLIVARLSAFLSARRVAA